MRDILKSLNLFAVSSEEFLPPAHLDNNDMSHYRKVPLKYKDSTLVYKIDSENMSSVHRASVVNTIKFRDQLEGIDNGYFNVPIALINTLRSMGYGIAPGLVDEDTDYIAYIKKDGYVYRVWVGPTGSITGIYQLPKGAADQTPVLEVLTPGKNVVTDMRRGLFMADPAKRFEDQEPGVVIEMRIVEVPKLLKVYTEQAPSFVRWLDD
ncbi:hypothetical protein [Bacillus subtilis]|uniref:hypothetical protein n=1 Tax=Bacillus subtilis TaxID=1423 RepID=UPI001A94D62C|nr:hypothetical protein [Bacillus subtilis]